VAEKLISMTNDIKNFCRRNRDIIFTRADKGNVTVALRKSTNLRKMEDVLDDINTHVIV